MRVRRARSIAALVAVSVATPLWWLLPDSRGALHSGTCANARRTFAEPADAVNLEAPREGGISSTVVSMHALNTADPGRFQYTSTQAPINALVVGSDQRVSETDLLVRAYADGRAVALRCFDMPTVEAAGGFAHATMALPSDVGDNANSYLLLAVPVALSRRPYFDHFALRGVPVLNVTADVATARLRLDPQLDQTYFTDWRVALDPHGLAIRPGDPPCPGICPPTTVTVIDVALSGAASPVARVVARYVVSGSRPTRWPLPHLAAGALRIALTYASIETQFVARAALLRG